MTPYWKQQNWNLVMNKLFFSLFFLILTSIPLFGQLSFNWQGGSDYLSIENYAGATSVQSIASLKISGNGRISFSNWKLSARITNYPVRDGNQYFPVEKVSFLPERTEGILSPGPVPTVAQIGMPASISLLPDNAETFLVPQSNAPIVNSSPRSYFHLDLYFKLRVEGGAYLSKFYPWSEFPFEIEYTLYDQYNNVIGKLQHIFKIQIQNLGNPQNSISISTDASNALLEFNAMQDYVDGKSVTYNNGLSLSATTDYQVTVRSIYNSFTSLLGNTLPLSVLSFRLEGEHGTFTPVTLSTQTSTILQGGSTGGEPVYFDMIYFTGANDERLFNIPSDHYSTQLMFEITPR